MEKTMKYKIITVAAMLTALSLPASVHADEPTAVSPTALQKSMEMQCPAMGNMGAMQKDMGSMMGDMDSMMQMMSDPAMRKHMQEMHVKMGSMMKQMSDMQKGMGGMMMQGGKIDDKSTNDAPAAVSP
jgi:hypothetical protein